MILFIFFLLPSLNFQVYTLLHIQSIYLPSPCLSTLEHFNNSSENFSHFLYCWEKYNSTPFLSTQCFLLYFLVNHYQICHCTLQMSLFNYYFLPLTPFFCFNLLLTEVHPSAIIWDGPAGNEFHYENISI